MIVRAMTLIVIMTLVVLPLTHIVYLIAIASHLTPEVIILPTTQLQLTLKLLLLSSPTIACRAPSWLTTVNHEMSAKCLLRVVERDVLLNHATAEVQGVFLTQLTAYAVNDDVEIVIEVPSDGVGRASVLSMG
jgi:long-subunit acyl-CoA synthetase (AMP-forming)